jgi:peptide/nickel transport system ATP-binding protein
MASVLSVNDLTTHFFTADGVVRAVEDVSFDLEPGETLGVVGESGCGKSVTALSIMGLIPARQGRIIKGSIKFEGRDLGALTEAQMRGLRGNALAMVFQEPMTSLNPVMTVGDQIVEAIRIHQGLSSSQAAARAVEMLDLVRIPDPRRCASEYPHQFSGGMRQRVMIAMALSCNPRVLIADEPTTALDVTIQAQVLDLMRNLKKEFGTAIILITHNFGVVAEMADRVVVMYAGRKVEEAPVGELFNRPMHPYTRGLMASIPRLGRTKEKVGERRSPLQEIPGIVPSLNEEIVGCAFAPRCPFVNERSCRQTPPLENRGGGHLVACWEVDRVLAS